MVSAIVSRVMVSWVGTLYPAYRSYKAVRTKDVREYVKWMMYWIVYAIFLALEPLLDTIVYFWLPFYYELKFLFVLWLITPYTKGASVLYRKFIHPALNVHEEQIDIMLDQAKNGSVKTILQLGSQGVTLAREVVANAALGGTNQLLNQMRRSYSTGDVNEDGDGAPHYNGPQIEEILEEEEDEGAETVVEGYYDQDGRLVENRLDAHLQPRRPNLRPRRGQRQEEKYATLPRSGIRSNAAVRP